MDGVIKEDLKMKEWFMTGGVQRQSAAAIRRESRRTESETWMPWPCQVRSSSLILLHLHFLKLL
jgi:hypothetical protein